MTADDFIRSAAAAAAPLAQPGARVGARILGAIEATAAAVGTNTNLGIVLLCAPLAAAAEEAYSDLRDALGDVLDDLDPQDAELAFRAIVQAAPAGLGHASRQGFALNDPVVRALRKRLPAQRNNRAGARNGPAQA